MRRFLKRYSGFARCSMEVQLAYRKSFFVQSISSLVGIMVSIFLWKALFAEQSTVQGYDWNQMILYALIAALVNATMSFGLELDMGGRILDGSIASDLTKPVDFQNMCFFQAIGQAFIEGLITLVLVVSVAVLVTDLSAYLVPWRLLLFGISLLLAFFLKFCLVYLGVLMCFFTSNGYGVVYLRQVICDVFSGAMLPLSFYPLWFQRLAGVLPFQASVYLPTQIFLGRIDGYEIARVLLLQIIWAVTLWVLGKLFFRFAVRKITIQGG